MTQTRERPPPAGGDLPELPKHPSYSSSLNGPQSAPAQAFSHRRAPHIRIVAPAPPPRPRRLDVRIAASDGREPIGRTRPIRLSDRDVDELVDFALRLEGRA